MDDPQSPQKLSSLPLKPPRRRWVKTRPCRCGLCRYTLRTKCPLLDSVLDARDRDWLYVSYPVEGRNDAA
jgi:hypothetical protein